MLLKQVPQKIVIFVIIGIFKYRVYISTKVYNRFHDLLMMSMNLSDIAI